MSALGKRSAAANLVLVLGAGLCGCVVGPNYVRPAVETPPAWQLEAPWREGTPDDAAPKGPWWQRFGDARLDALQADALAQSPTLALANARLAQARAVVAANEDVAAAGAARPARAASKALP